MSHEYFDGPLEFGQVAGQHAGTQMLGRHRNAALLVRECSLDHQVFQIGGGGRDRPQRIVYGGISPEEKTRPACINQTTHGGKTTNGPPPRESSPPPTDPSGPP